MASIPQLRRFISDLFPQLVGRVPPGQWRLVFPLGVMAAIFWFSAQPSSVLPHWGWVDALWENGGHFIGYALLAAAWIFALGRSRRGAAWWLSVLYALSDEFHQHFVPGRAADWRDVLVDALGAALVVWGAGNAE